MCRVDRLNLQSDRSFFRDTNSVSSGNHVREAALSHLELKRGRNNRRKVKGTFCAYSIRRPMVHQIEKYSSEKVT